MPDVRHAIRAGLTASARRAMLLSFVPGALLAAFAVASVGANANAAAVPVGSAHRVALGAFIQNSYDHPKLIRRYAEEVGRRPVIVSRYPNWSSPPFKRSALAPIWRGGAVPLVTWEPWNEAEKGYPLQAIAAGRYDSYIRRSARAAKAWGKPILLRFAHEMNGDWYPWGRQPGNSPEIYIAAWRHVVHLFRQEGADKVEWVWAPNVNEQAGSSIDLPIIGGGGESHPFPFDSYFPGEAWVDWVGLDGFNWGNTGKWQSFTNIFSSSYDDIVRMTHRPILITEIASNERGGDKAEWISSAFEREIPRFPRIRGVVWFNEPFGGVQAKVGSSPSSLHAFRKALASPIYGMTRSEFLATPHWLPTGPPAPDPPSGGYGAPSFVQRSTEQIRRHLLELALILAGIVVVIAFGTYAAARTRRRRRV